MNRTQVNRARLTSARVLFYHSLSIRVSTQFIFSKNRLTGRESLFFVLSMETDAVFPFTFQPMQSNTVFFVHANLPVSKQSAPRFQASGDCLASRNFAFFLASVKASVIGDELRFAYIF